MSDYFPPEVIEKILLRLPVSTLIACTTINRCWYSIIRSPSFISSYLYKPENPLLLLRRCCYKHDNQERYSLLEVSKNKPLSISSSSQLKLHVKSQSFYFRIVGSCYGVICLFDDFYVKPRQRIVLWNPSIEKHLVLPERIINPKKTRFVLGIGLVDQDFKVVRLVYYKKRDESGLLPPPEAEVFSLRTGSWRRLSEINIRLQIDHLFWCQVFLNGVVHWLGHNSLNDNNDIHCSILTFRVSQEVFVEITLPDELAMESLTNLSLSLIGESLAVINKRLVNNSHDVWLMKDYGFTESWTKLYSIDLVDHDEKVVAFRKSGEVLLVNLSGLAAYDPEIREHNYLDICGVPYSFLVDDYVESLHLLGHENETTEELSESSEEDMIGGNYILF